MTQRFFITGTDTGVGKTTLTETLVLAARALAIDAIGLKPLETGCGETGEAIDARILAAASGDASLANFRGFYRARLPLAPYAAALEGESPPPSISTLVEAISRAEEGRSLSLIEGAGGLLVPYSRTHDTADLAIALRAPIVLVAADRLGTLSATLTATESAERRGLEIRAIVLSGINEPDPSRNTNLAILRERLPHLTILPFPFETLKSARIERAKTILNALAPCGSIS